MTNATKETLTNELKNELINVHKYSVEEAEKTAAAYCSATENLPFAFHRSIKSLAEDLARTEKIANSMDITNTHK